MSIPTFALNEAAFLARYGIEADRFAECGLKWDELVAIANEHCANYSGLLPVANYVTERLRQLPDVHTLRLRIKDPEHLIEKIIRKNPGRPVPITRENYQHEVTDLIGIRALHLFKDQWKPIHDFVTHTWNTHEQPIAYLREGDSQKLVVRLQESGCKVEYHDYGYRSVHYLIKVQPEKKVHIIELQVRTVFEEGWSEIDHRVRYPNHTKDERLEEFLVLFNRLAGSADEMGSFIKNLSSSLHHDADRLEKMEQQLRDKEKDLQKSEEALKDAVAHLDISKNEKADLQKRINELTEKRQAVKVLSTRTTEFVTNLSTFGADSAYFTASTGMSNAPGVITSWGKVCSKCGTPIIAPTSRRPCIFLKETSAPVVDP